MTTTPLDRVIVNFFLFGDSKCGKTSIIRRYVDNTFNVEEGPIGFDFKLKYHDPIDGKIPLTRLWDDTRPTFQIRSRAIPNFKNMSAVFLVFDVTDRQSFELIEEKLKSLPQFSEYTAELYIIGNKCDLIEQRVVSQEEAMNLAAQHGAVYFNASVKDNINIKDRFDTISKFHFYKELNKPPPPPKPSTSKPTPQSRCNIM